MRTVYVPFSMGSRCALTDWHQVPGFHACELVPDFADDARLVVFTREDFDRWKGLLANALAHAVAAARDWLKERALAEAPRPAHAA